MKGFFNRLVSSNSTGSINNPGNSNSSNDNSFGVFGLNRSNSDKKNKAIVGKTSNDLDRKNQSNAVKADIIRSAAKTLTQVIDTNIKDSSIISGDNNAGFYRLITLLESESKATDIDTFSYDSYSNGEGCLGVLIRYIDHDNFVDILCEQNNIAELLFNCMRLLRAFEIKHRKSLTKDEILSQSNSGITYTAMSNIIKVMSKLIVDSRITEQLRPCLVKLLVYPLGCLPDSAIHLQLLSAEVISSLCKGSLPTALIWYLHDQQLMVQIVRNINDLINIQGLYPSNDILLSGLEAEKFGMWEIAFKCVVDIIAASLSTTAVLLTDLEQANGFASIVFMIENSAISRSMIMMNLAMRLMFDPNKSNDEPVAFPSVGKIFNDVLILTIGIKREITRDDSFDKIIIICQHLQDFPNKIKSKEHLLSSLAYSLLTIYSNEPKNCIILEESYHYLPTLIVSIVSVESSDTISAILTTLNYVCQCVEIASTLSLISLCVVSYVITHTAIMKSFQDESIDNYLLKLDLLLASIDVILRSNPKYALVFINIGLLNYLICKPFEDLNSMISTDSISTSNSISVDIYLKLIQLLINLEGKSPYISDEIKNSGLLLHVRTLILSSLISIPFTKKLLSIFETIAQSQRQHLEESLQTLLDLLNILSCNDSKKSTCIIESIHKIFFYNDESSIVWKTINGREFLMNWLDNYGNSFDELNDPNILMLENTSLDNFEQSKLQFTEKNLNEEDNFQCIKAIIYFIEIDIKLSYTHPFDQLYEDINHYFINFFKVMSLKILSTGLFKSIYHKFEGISLLIYLLTGNSESRLVSNYEPTYLCLFTLPYLSSDLSKYLLENQLIDILRSQDESPMKLSECGINRFIIKTYYNQLLFMSDVVTKLLRDFISYNLSHYQSVEDFHYVIKYLIRPNIIPVQHLKDQKLFPSWIAFYNNSKITKSLETNPDIVDFFEFIKTIYINNKRLNAPFVRLGENIPLGRDDIMKNGELSIPFNNQLNFPLNNFTIILWLQINAPATINPSQSVNLMTLINNSTGVEVCFMEISLSIFQKEISIVFQNSEKSLSLCKFSIPQSINICNNKSWMNLSILYRKVKKLSSFNKSVLSVFLNGLQCEMIESYGDQLFENDLSQNLGLILGKSLLRSTLEAISFNLATFAIYDEILSPNQILYIFIKDIQLNGNYHGTDINETVSVLSSKYLMKYTDVHQLSDFSDLKLLEVVCDPVTEPHFEGISIPFPLVLINIECSKKVRFNYGTIVVLPKTENVTDFIDRVLVRHGQISLSNFSILHENPYQPISSLSLNSYVSLSRSVGSSVSSLGGPIVLFPIIQNASTENSLQLSLDLLRSVVKENDFNLKFMKRSGYKILSFIMSIKPTILLTEKVLNSLYEFSIQRTLSSTILIDTSALYYLILNHQVWGIFRYNIAYHILTLLNSLVKDPINGHLNSKRLANLGISSWIISSSLIGVEISSLKLSTNKDIKKFNIANNYWDIQSQSDRSISDNNDDKDPFLHMAMNILIQVIGTDIRHRDLEMIGNVVLYTFSPSLTYTSNVNTKDLGKSPNMPVGMVYSVEKKQSEKSSEKVICRSESFSKLPSNALSLFIFFRVYLIRLIYSLYEENVFDIRYNKSRFRSQSTDNNNTSNNLNTNHNTSSDPTKSINLFHLIFNVDWLLNIIDISSDISTRSIVLRLLTLFIQSNLKFYKELVSKNKMKIFENLFLYHSNNELSIVLPLVALAFNVPIQLLPFPIQVNSSSKILQLIDLEDCTGPKCFESDIILFTLPLISLLFDFYVSNSKLIQKFNEDYNHMIIENSKRSEKKNDVSNEIMINDIILGMILKYIKKEVSFRQIFQRRYAVDILSSTMLSCSNALDDYGTRLHLSASLDNTDVSQSKDIISSIKDDYLSLSKFGTIDEIDTYRTIDEEENSISSNSRSIGELTLNEEGLKILSLIQSVIYSGFLDFENPIILCHFVLSFPNNMDESFIGSFQLNIFQQAKKAMNSLLSNHFSYKLLSLISNNITYLISIARARILHEVVQFEILQYLCELINLYKDKLEKVDKNREINKQGLHKELKMSARYFSSILLYIATSDLLISASGGESFCLRILVYVRNNFLNLLSNNIEDSYDISNIASLKINRPTNLDEMTVNMPILDLFLVTYSNDSSKKLSDLLYISSLERLKLSNIFILITLASCYNLILHDNKVLMLESLRLISLLTIHRMTIVKQIFMQEVIGNKQKLSSEDVNVIAIRIFDDGIIRLLPPSSAMAVYESFLIGNSNDNEDEEKRVSDFCYWFTERIDSCNKFFKSIDDSVKVFIPLNYDTSAIIRQIQIQRVKDVGKEFSSSINANDLSTYCSGNVNEKLISKLINNIRKFKIRGFSSLAIGSVLWKQSHEILQSGLIWGYNILDTLTESNFNNLLKCKISNFKGCRLDPSEGPEGMRRKVDQDYKTFIDESIYLSFETNDENKTVLKSQNAKSLEDSTSTPKDGSSTPFSKNLNIAGTYEGINKALSNLGSILRWGPSSTNSNMENLAKEIAKQGIKRLDSSNSYDDVDTGMTSLYNSNIASSTDQQNLSTDTREDSSIEAFESEESINRLYPNNPYDKLDNYEYNDDDNITGTQSPEITSVLESIKDLVINIEDPKVVQSFSESTNNTSIEIQSQQINNTTKVTKSVIIEEILKGFIGTLQWNSCYIYNIERIFGLEATPGLLILTSEKLFIINGFSISSNTKDYSFKYQVKNSQLNNNNNYQKEFTWLLDDSKGQDNLEVDNFINFTSSIWKCLLNSDTSFYKMILNDIYSVFKRRHHLKYSGVEITDKDGYSILLSCETVEECNTILSKLFHRELPPIIFRHVNGFNNIQSFLGVPNVYKSLMSQYLSNLTKLWQVGEMSNFEYLMKLNSASGRSFQDLTQYPVFPWILSDYTSKVLDLDDPLIYRDLSKPMGALGYKRSLQFKERFKTMAEFRKDGVDNTPPPFHYGTHFSCAGYVLYYLIRLQPYSNYAMALQGGQFDISDRLFLSIESSWRSASQENLQDVRELIPEFFYLPEFLTNLNEFDLGKTQKGDLVNNVELPTWANDDPREFIRIHRAALESKYVSENLHHWIDLIFGYKQRDEESMNVFIHLTYDGEVDVDDITDPILKIATISQINNFGQTPSMLFSKPHPKKIVPEIFRKVNDVVTIDTNALSWHGHVSPPLCVNGASQLVILNKISYSQIIPSSNYSEVPNLVNNMQVINSKIIAVSKDCSLIPPNYKKYVRFGSSGGGLLFLSHTPVLQREFERDYQNIENLHERPISSAVFTKDGQYLLTGSLDTSIRLWKLYHVNNRYDLEYIYTFAGHTSRITCLDIDMKLSMVVSGSSDRSAAIWDCRTGRLRCLLSSHIGSVRSVSINTINGNIVTLTSTQLRLYSINGDLLCRTDFKDHSNEVSQMTEGTVVLAPPCPEWQNGVIAVTGHDDGTILLWKFRTTFIESEVIRSLYIAYCPTKTHRVSITSLSLVNSANYLIRIKDLVDRSFDDNGSLDLLVGDSEGFISRWSALRLDQLPQSDLQNLATSRASM